MAWTRDTIIKVAKRTGHPVVAAWSGNNAGTMGTIYGPVLHHTGTSATAAGDYPTLKVVRDGRPGLENSLAMYGIGRSGIIYCINDKISWHAGVGDWKGITDGNGHFAGIEAEGPYASGKWPAAELDAYQKLVASILIETGRGLDWAPTHAEWADPPGRKTDPQGFDVAAFRQVVQKYLNDPTLLTKTEPKRGGDDVEMILIRNSKGTVALLGGNFVEWVPTTADHKALLAVVPMVQLSDGFFDRLTAAANRPGDKANAIN